MIERREREWKRDRDRERERCKSNVIRKERERDVNLM